MKIGIAIDSWKLEIFKKHLKDFKYEVHPGVTDNTLSLIVNTEDKYQLIMVAKTANEECSKTHLN